MKTIVFLIFLISFALTGPSSIEANQAELPETVKQAVLEIVKSGVELHSVRVSKKKDQEKVVLTDVTGKLDTLIGSLDPSDFRFSHLRKVARTLKSSIELYSESSGKTTKTHLQNFFKELAEVNRLYRVARYPIYFCNVDRSYWIQNRKLKTGRNPVNPTKLLYCGRRV